MRGDENKNIDVPSKVKAFRKDFPPDTAAISTSFEVVELAGAPAVVGHAVVTATARTDAFTPGAVLAEAYATRGLRAPIAGAQGMKDTRDAERAMTGAVGRALFLMGYGEKPDDSVDYEEPESGAPANTDAQARLRGALDGLMEHDPERHATVRRYMRENRIGWPMSEAEMTQVWATINA